MMLVDLGGHIDRKAALTLALETVNGWQTAPMKDEAIDTPSRKCC